MAEELTISLLYRTTSIVTKYDSITKITGENFNVFNVLGMGSSEVKLHSALIAELINPNGKHGQGVVFLNHFLKTLQEESLYDGTDKIFHKGTEVDLTVEVEKWIGEIKNENTQGGYIDIVITTTKTKESIIIENKIYANDQIGQLRRYHNYNKKAILIYLTLNGRNATDETTFNDRYPENKITPICISYKTIIIKWLDKCRKDAVNLPILRETITQYIYLLKQLTHQTTNHNMKNEIVDMIAQNSEFIRSSQQIWDNQDAIKLKIIRNLMDDLRDRASKEGWHFGIAENSGIVGKDDTGFGFLLGNKPYWIYYYFRDNYDNLEVGIEWAPNQTKDEDLRDKIREHFWDFEYGPKLAVEDWIWGCKFHPWSKTTWAEKQSIIPSKIIETTEIFRERLNIFNP